MTLRQLLPALLFAAVAAGGAAAQVPFDVVVGEVLYDPEGPDQGHQLIEIHNRDVQSANLNGWGLAVCYPGSIQDNRTYWPFPSYFSIPPGGVATVHWMADGMDVHPEYYTGSLAHNFICVTPPKPLSLTDGSVALYRTTDCTLFSSFLQIVDFVQWGGSTHHEVQAHAAGEWISGTYVPLVPEGHSIAYDGDGDGFEHWWEDASPTPSLPNVYPGTATSASYGMGCDGSAGVPGLGSSGGPPAMGNQSYRLELDGALPGAAAVIGMSSASGAVPLFGCVAEIDVAGLILQLGPKTTDGAGEASYPLPVPDDLTLLGVTLYFQGAVVDPGSVGGVVALSTAFEATL